MRIEIEIPKEFESDYIGDKFKDFFSRVLCDIEKGVMCGNYEKEIAEMFTKAFDESKTMELMQGDLISRSALKKVLSEKYSGLSDARDEEQFALYSAYKQIVRVIENQPTAYDVEKVVEKLEEKSNDIPIQYEMNYEKGFGDGIDYSVDIVRNGGKE